MGNLDLLFSLISLFFSNQSYDDNVREKKCQ